MNLPLTGNSRLDNQDAAWGGNFSVQAARIFTNGTTYNGTSYLDKYGLGDDYSNGDNVFNQSAQLVNLSDRYFVMAHGLTNPDIFNGDLLVSNLGNGRIRLANRAVGNQFNGNITVENPTGIEVTFGIENGSATLANGQTVSVGGLGFNAGDLYFRNFTQVGGTAQNIVLTGTARIFNHSANWQADFTGIAPRINTRESVYDGVVYLEKNGTTDDDSHGANIFNQDATIVNSGNRRLRFASNGGAPDIFNGTTTIRNIGSNEIWMGDVAVGNQFNGNIILESQASNGIRFGRSGTASSTLANGFDVSIGPLGFDSGILQFLDFTQLGTTSQNVVLTGSGFLENYNATWEGDFSGVAPRLNTRSSSYLGTAYLEKSGAGNDAAFGDNTFNGSTEIVTSGTGYLRSGNNVQDLFLGAVIYRQLGTGVNRPTFNTNSQYHGNVSVQAPGSFIWFGEGGGGRASFVGGNAQEIADLGSSSPPLFDRLTIDKSSAEVTLQTPVEVRVELQLLAQNIISDATNLLIMRNASTVSAVSNSSFIEGPVRKIGNQAFTFPVGKNGWYRPCSISAPANNTHHFTAEYFMDNPWPFYPGNLREPTLQDISHCEYWIIDRTNGASNVIVTLSWDQSSPSCSGVSDPNTLAVARWDGGLWRDHGNGGITGGIISGTINSNGVVTNFSPFTLATYDLNTPLPIELISFVANPNESVVELDWITASERDNSHFVIERSADGQIFDSLMTIQGAGNSTELLHYVVTDLNPLNGVSYYRLKQVDFNGEFSYSPIRSVYFGLEGADLVVFPNPARSGQAITISGGINESNIDILDMTGKLILSQPYTGKIQVNLSPGIYSVHLTSESGQNVARLVVN